MKALPVWLAALSLAAAAPAIAQTPAAFSDTSFPFVIPWDDASQGTATDVSFLNTKPAGANGFIIVKDGHFAESKTGQRINFLGMNFAAGTPFHTHDEAAKIAAHIAKLGVNIVRITMIDNEQWGPHNSLLDFSYPDREHFDASQLDKLDYIISQFEKDGIYVNLDLHVGCTYTQADGFPASIDQIPTQYDNRVDEFDPKMIALQKQYARHLLTHINPYTSLAYTEDPAVVVIESNNEDSLVGDPWGTLGEGLDSLPEPFLSELKTDWNKWLIKKYGSNAAMLSSWQKQTPPGGPPIDVGSPWTADSLGDAQVSMTTGTTSKGMPFVQADTTQVDGTKWHAQAHLDGLNLNENGLYTVSFWAKADTPRTVTLCGLLDGGDYHNIGLGDDVDLTTDWKQYSYSFTAKGTVADDTRIGFFLGGQTGNVWIAGMTVQPGAWDLPAGQSLTEDVDIPMSGLKPAWDDWLQFLADTERAYAEEMRSYLRDTLHVHANIDCSQVCFGGLSGLNRETGNEFADNHAYWDMMTFPDNKINGLNWNIKNVPMASDLASGGGGTLRDLAEYRVAGKPYSISEYDHPAPNDYRAETLPEIATFAAYQDWDMVYLFDYGDYGNDSPQNMIVDNVAEGCDPAKIAFLPAIAMILRAQEIEPSVEKSTLNLAPAQLTAMHASVAWQSAGGGSDPNIFDDRLALEVNPATPGETTAPRVTQVSTGDNQSDLSVSSGPSGAMYEAIGPSAQAVAGFVGGQKVNLGDNTFDFSRFGNNFAAMTLTSMDKKPLAQSHRLLITLVGKVENKNMGWDAARTTVSNHWGNGPTMAEGIPAVISIKTSAASSVWALDDTGHRTVEVPSSVSNGMLTFTVGAQYKTLWYEVSDH